MSGKLNHEERQSFPIISLKISLALKMRHQELHKNAFLAGTKRAHFFLLMLEKTNVVCFFLFLTQGKD